MRSGQNVTIIRDAYGVPHVFADSEPGALYGFGYAQAQDRLSALLGHYLASRGEAASILGAGYLERDIAIRAYRLPETAAKRYSELSDELRNGIESFVAGINRFQSDHSEKCPAWAFAVSPTDVVSLGLMYNLYFATDHFERSPATFGSNGFAVAGERTASGNAIVSIDPHLAIDGALRWYEGHVTGGALNMYGVAFVGTPYMAMGTNGRIAWANTVNAPDLSDLYEIRLRQDAGKPPVYEYDGGTRPCDVRKYSFSVRHGNGDIRTVGQTVVSTHHGPILKEENGKRYAIRKAGIGDVHVLTQVREQCLAQNVDEYRAALAGCHTVMFNHLFGDATGSIGYISAGSVPRRPDGFDFHAPVPGWTSATEWGTTLTIDELPQAIRPASGFVQNCNDNPGYCGADDMQVPPPYPDFLAPNVRTLRGDQMREMLQTEAALTPEHARIFATDCTDLNAKRELDALLRSASERRSVVDAVGVLAKWDGRLHSDSRGAALFQVWLLQPWVQSRLKLGGYLMAHYAETVPLAEADFESNAIVLNPIGATEALADAAEWLRAYGYPLDVKWGDLHRLRRGNVDLPCDGGLDSLVPFGGRLNEADGKTTVTFGTSFRSVVELRPDGNPDIWACLPWGNSDDPASPHYADQLPLAARREYRRVPWTREAVRAEATAEVRL
ncbi:MAG: penicillin acylase family protein [Akkermansiaceae bacterium]|nr:penicillin acylase family protein [Armatimonadota bacterium]